MAMAQFIKGLKVGDKEVGVFSVICRCGHYNLVGATWDSRTGWGLIRQTVRCVGPMNRGCGIGLVLPCDLPIRITCVAHRPPDSSCNTPSPLLPSSP